MVTSQTPARIGIFGGTFDPIHLGHLRSAEEVRELFDLTEVLFMPAARPPHKEAGQVIDAAHRLRMIELATTGNDAFAVCPLELERPGPSFSIDTLRWLQKERGPEADLYFITGTDAFMEIHTWKDVEGLLKTAHFVVTSRPGYPIQELLQTLEKTVTARWPSLSFKLSFDAALGLETLQAAPSKKHIYLVHIIQLDISATDIRRRVRAGRSIRYLVSKSVEQYIYSNLLYRESS